VTSKGVFGSSDAATYRFAAGADALAVSSLYREAYDPQTGAPPEEFYPFPDLMSPEKLAILLENKLWLWIVACRGTEVIGVVGAKIANQAGTARPMLADMLGLVVRADCRRRGAGQHLLRHITAELDSRVDWILAETRVNTPASWKPLRKCGYRIFGYEPACHKTPAGYEAMLLQGKVSPRRLRLRRAGTPGNRLEKLANEISRNLCPAVNENGGFAAEAPVEGKLPDRTSASPAISNGSSPKVEVAICVRQLQRHLCSTRLKRFTIEMPSLAMAAEIDPIDLRLYIASLVLGTTFSAGDLRNLFGEIEQYMLDHNLQSSVIEVEISRSELIEILLEKRYKPTAVYSALVSDGSCFNDVVQFTRSLKTDTAPSDFSIFDMEEHILSLLDSM
jgi:ribosomal protein S18 acetylase RimI-like enzyme